MSSDMKKFLILGLILCLAAGCKERSAAPAESPVTLEPALDSLTAVKSARTLPEEPVFDIQTNLGTIKVRLYKDTPRHKANFERLALSGYYDSLLFHRCIKGFVIQGGDPYTRDTSKVKLYGQGGPSYTLPAEMRDSLGQPLHRHKRGALAAARRGDLGNPFKESSGSQFYLVQDAAACTHLDGEYTVFGETVAGLNVIDKIASVKTDRNGLPLSEVRIISVQADNEWNKLGTDLAEKPTE